MGISRKSVFVCALFLVAAAAIFLLAFRMIATGKESYLFLLWNLFLAAVPYWVSILFERTVRNSNVRLRRRLPWSGSAFLLWLFFFPNAPYIVTDFIHLPWEYPATFRFAYDFAMVGMFTLSGLLLGMASLFRVHRTLRNIVGTVRADLGIVVIVFLSGIGIYLGRFLRWNSWDVFLNPIKVFLDTVAHYGDPAWSARAVFFSLLFSACIGISYVIFAGAYRLLGERMKNEEKSLTISRS